MVTQWWTDYLTHYSSPYDFNPLNINPLRDHLEKTVDFEKVRALTELKLFVAATNVDTGRIKVFEGPEDYIQAVLSARGPRRHRRIPPLAGSSTVLVYTLLPSASLGGRAPLSCGLV
jgi:hypothetical protein